MIGTLTDTDRNRLVDAVAHWLKTVELPTYVTLQRHSVDKVFYEAHLSAGEPYNDPIS
jgi:hypothetical protein